MAVPLTEARVKEKYQRLLLRLEALWRSLERERSIAAASGVTYAATGKIKKLCRLMSEAISDAKTWPNIVAVAREVHNDHPTLDIVAEFNAWQVDIDAVPPFIAANIPLQNVDLQDQDDWADEEVPEPVTVFPPSNPQVITLLAGLQNIVDGAE